MPLVLAELNARAYVEAPPATLSPYDAGGTLVSAKLGQPLVKLNFQQEAREADFRYGLVRVRENAESIAFYGGEAAERNALVVGPAIAPSTRFLTHNSEPICLSAPLEIGFI